MLNEERIRLMTKLAIYEEGEGKKTIPMSRFYRSDFIGRAIMKSFIIGTILYGILLGIWIIYQMENFLNGDLDEMIDNLRAADNAEKLKGTEE